MNKRMLKKMVVKSVAKMTEAEVKKNMDPLPPCLGFFHQPKRPLKSGRL